MADDDDDDAGESAGEGEGGEEGESKKSNKTKLFLFIGLALLLVIGGAAAAYFTGLLDPMFESTASGEEGGATGTAGTPTLSGKAVFYDLPELLVNLNAAGRKSAFLKIRISLELQQAEDIPKIEGMMPRIIDNFQVYLRELRVEDLKGSAGMYRLREELLTRVAAAAAPAKVNDVLFKEMLVQ